MKSSMVVTDFFSYGSLEKRHQLSPLRITFCILITISSLILPGTGCMMMIALAFITSNIDKASEKNGGNRYRVLLQKQTNKETKSL